MYLGKLTCILNYSENIFLLFPYYHIYRTTMPIINKPLEQQVLGEVIIGTSYYHVKDP